MDNVFGLLAKQFAAGLYQPIEHPAFAHLKVTQPCIKRFEMIRAALSHYPLRCFRGTMLDIGCHTGWFSRAFARDGWAVTGIDRSSEWLTAAKILNVLCEPGVISPEYLFAEVEKTPLPYADVALCLSVIMYLFQKSTDGAWAFLDHLSTHTNIAFIDFGGMYADHVPFNRENAAEAILGKTHWTAAQFLGVTDFEDRPLFMFKR